MRKAVSDLSLDALILKEIVAGMGRCAKQGYVQGSTSYDGCVAQHLQRRLDQRAAVRGDLLAGTAVAAAVGATILKPQFPCALALRIPR